DVYRLIQEEDHFAKIHQDTNPDCVIGKNIQTALDEIYTNVDLKIIEELNTTTVKDLAMKMAK
ncbi:transcriptional regulator, partial [Mammaliicoccus sciuri]